MANGMLERAEASFGEIFVKWSPGGVLGSSLDFELGFIGLRLIRCFGIEDDGLGLK